MATVALSTSPTQIDAGSSYSVLVANTGSSPVELSRGGRLRPGQTQTVYPEGSALMAASLSGAGQVTTTTVAGKPLPNPSDPANLATDPAFTGTYARPTFALKGNRGAFLGDSTTQQDDINASFLRENSWPLYAQLLSGGRIQYVQNAGVAGDTTAQMLARVDADVLAYSPTFCTVMGGTNDAGAATPIATTAANLTAIADRLMAAGVLPVMATICPRNSTTTAIRSATLTINAWVRRFASARGYPLLDFYKVLVDPASTVSAYRSTYNDDNTHPSPLGYAAMAQHVVDVLAPLLPYSYPPLVVDPGDLVTMIGNPLNLTDTNADGIPDSWSAVGNAQVATFTHSLVTDANLPGKGMQIARTAGTGVRTLKATATPVTAGSKIGVGGVVTSDGNSFISVVLQWTGPGTSYNVLRISRPVTRGVFWAEYTAPTGTTAVDLRWTVEDGTGTAALYQPTVLNLTALGLA